MSVQEIQIEQSQERFGLKRKLTGPPRLLLGKFRTKTQGDNQTEVHTKGPNGMNDSKGPVMGSPKNPQGTMGDDGSLESFQGLPEEEKRSERTSAAALEGGARRSEAERDDGSMVKGRAKKGPRRWLWTPSLVCIGRRRRRLCGEQAADPKSSLPGGLPDSPTGPSKDPKATVTPGQGAALRTGSTLRLIASKKPREAHSEATAQSGSNDQLPPKASFRKKMGLFFKCGKKNSSTSAEHMGARDKETTELSLPVQGEASIPGGDCSEFGGHLTVSVEVSHLGQGGTGLRGPVGGSSRAEGGGSPVGVRKMTEERKPRRCCTDEPDRPDRRLKSDLPSSLPPLMEEKDSDWSPETAATEKDSHWSPETAATEKDSDWSPETAAAEKDSDWSPETAAAEKDSDWSPETAAAEKDSDWSPETAATEKDSDWSLEAAATEKDSDWSRKVRVDSHKETDARSSLDVTHAEKDRVPEQVGAEDATGACLSLSGIALEDSVQDALALNGIDSLGHLSRDAAPVDIDTVLTNGPMGSPLEDLHVGSRSLVNDLPCGESGPRNCETLLVQTASSLVQAAVKAALEQLASELEVAAAGVHQEAQACKCQL